MHDLEPVIAEFIGLRAAGCRYRLASSTSARCGQSHPADGRRAAAHDTNSASTHNTAPPFGAIGPPSQAQVRCGETGPAMGNRHLCDIRSKGSRSRGPDSCMTGISTCKGAKFDFGGRIVAATALVITFDQGCVPTTPITLLDSRRKWLQSRRRGLGDGLPAQQCSAGAPPCFRVRVHVRRRLATGARR